MRHRAFALAAWLAFGLAAPAGAEVAVGDEAPDVAIKEWIKGDACRSLKDLRGKAVLLEFFATT